MLKIVLLSLVAAAAFTIYSAGGIVASKDKVMAMFERASATAVGRSDDWA